MSEILYSGHDSDQKPEVIAIIYLDDVRISIEDLGQEYVDTVEWPEPKSVRVIVDLRVRDSSWTSDLCCTTYPQFEDSIVINNDG